MGWSNRSAPGQVGVSTDVHLKIKKEKKRKITVTVSEHKRTSTRVNLYN